MPFSNSHVHEKLNFKSCVRVPLIRGRNGDFFMNLKHLADDSVLFETKNLALGEHEILTKLLWHIKEVERRRLFSKLKYQSINEYVEKELGYSRDEAWRRVAAARVLQEIPEIEVKINSGELNLTNIGPAQSLFQKEKRQAKNTFSKEQKLEVLTQIAGKTTRQAAKIVWSHSTLPVPEFREQVRVLTDELSEYTFAADLETQQDIERLKGLLAHSQPGMTTGQLVKKLCKLGLEHWDPTLKIALPRLKSKAEESRQTWRRAQCKCINCRTYYALQEDHFIPKAKGGGDEPDNKRLLCRNCNQRSAIEQLGMKKMDPYINKVESLRVAYIRQNTRRVLCRKFLTSESLSDGRQLRGLRAKV